MARGLGSYTISDVGRFCESLVMTVIGGTVETVSPMCRPSTANPNCSRVVNADVPIAPFVEGSGLLYGPAISARVWVSFVTRVPSFVIAPVKRRLYRLDPPTLSVVFGRIVTGPERTC